MSHEMEKFLLIISIKSQLHMGITYKSGNIASILKRLNTQYFLPAIRRQFVWKQDKIIYLLDFILR